ncbi:MAG: OmpA family protein [Bacteroidota bacterium]
MKKHNLFFYILFGISVVHMAFGQEDERFQQNVTIDADRPISRIEIFYDDDVNDVEEETKAKRKDPINKSKLVQKANYFFDKMWYAKAAEYYEMALAKGEETYTFPLLERAGDAHYYTTNMNRAHHWYSILYDRYDEQMDSENLFRYMNALKGTGKYARSKRISRLYNRTMDAESSSAKEQASPEVLESKLDEILNTKRNLKVYNLPINSKYSYFGPTFYGDQEVVFASARENKGNKSKIDRRNNQPFLDLYTAEIDSILMDFKNPARISDAVNSKFHEAGATFSPDGETMFFTRNNYKRKLKRDKKGVNHLKIYRSQKVDGEWSEVQEVPFNSDNYSTGHPAMSLDGKRLYFVSDMPGSIGKTDIFYVDLLEDGGYSSPVNLGPEVNTVEREMFPFATTNRIYFSSDGHLGLGGLDIFYAQISDEQFSQVKNAGRPINSNKDDFSYVFQEKTGLGYFASNRDGGKGDDDIYGFRDAVPVATKMFQITGTVKDEISKDVLTGVDVEIWNETEEQLITKVQTDEEGKFVLDNLEEGQQYIVKTKTNFYVDNQQTIIARENTDVEIALQKMEDLIVEEEGVLKLKPNNIYFDFDKSVIRDDASIELDKLVDALREHPDMVIKIESHTDARGNMHYNKKLSDRRAKASRDYIISQGIDASRIESAIGYGEETLLNGCVYGVECSEEEHELNRRSEFIIVKM